MKTVSKNEGKSFGCFSSPKTTLNKVTVQKNYQQVIYNFLFNLTKLN